jgi:hypothetical protein
MSQYVPHETGADLPGSACARLDPAVTGMTRCSA